MILVDAIFIIELFWRTFDSPVDENDYILSKPWLRSDIAQDLILLENQIPFFVLEELYVFFNDYNSSSNKENTTFLKLARRIFSNRYFSYYDHQQKSIVSKEIKHFTDLLRHLFCPPNQKPTETIDHLYCATKLDEAGVKFIAVSDRCLLDISFEKGDLLKRYLHLNCSWLLNCLPCLECFPFLERMQPFLELLRLIVHDASECMFRNLMAFEQCHYPSEAYVCNYIGLLDYLINTETDVDLLVDKQVIVNWLGSNSAVASLVNKLGHQVLEVNSCYFELSRQLNDHYNNPWNHNMAYLTKVYFRDIWRGTATVVGILVLGFTFWNFLRPLFAYI